MHEAVQFLQEIFQFRSIPESEFQLEVGALERRGGKEAHPGVMSQPQAVQGPLKGLPRPW